MAGGDVRGMLVVGEGDEGRGRERHPLVLVCPNG